MTIGLYFIRNISTGKFYVGRSKNVEARLKAHKELLEKGKHHCIHLQRSYNKNPDNFSFDEIIPVTDKEELVKLEQMYLDKYFGTLLYNTSPSARTGVLIGKLHPHYGKSPKEWQGRSYKPRKKSFGAENHFFGRQHTEETKQLLREKCPNYGPKNGFYGKKHSEEVRKKLSEKARGRDYSGSRNPAAKAILVDGIRYETVKEATKAVGYKSAVSFYKLMKREPDRFHYVD